MENIGFRASMKQKENEQIACGYRACYYRAVAVRIIF